MRQAARHRVPVGGAVLAAGIGALDGFGSSMDVNAGRAWTSPGVGIGGPVVVGWGWAPVVQISAVIVGFAFEEKLGPAPLCSGLALLARSSAFYVSRQHDAVPTPTQG